LEYDARAVAYLITEADVAYLLRAKKFIHRVIRNSADSRQEVLEVVVIYNVRRKDREHLELKLRFSARLEKPVKVTVPQPRPGVSLTWHGQRIRGISRRIKHANIRNGVVVGEVRGWYEHQWTNSDEDKSIKDINKEIKQEDFWSVVEFCLRRWNIEFESRKQLGQLSLGE
jgi:hypothetical protein